MAGTSTRKRRKRKKRGPRLRLLVLLALLVGIGAWNYQRNSELDAALPRPYRGYADADLDALAAAYESELDGLQQRYERAIGGRIVAREGESLADKVREFERVQHVSRSSRSLGYAISEREASLRKVEEERALRARDRMALFLQRVFTVPI